MNDKNYDVVIVGGGISGAALFYELARYTDVKKICILEKYEALATLNSKATSNSQTIHVGDIETNYTLEKAKITKRTAKMVEKFCLQYNLQDKVMFAHQKMALGVGNKEVEYIKNRYNEFKELFPYLELWDKEQLKEIEPKIVFHADGSEREENIVAMGAKDQYTTVNFGKMTEELVKQAQACEDVITDVYFNSQVENIYKTNDGFELVTATNDRFTAKFVIVTAGAHSLPLAHKMGRGKRMGSISMAGSFYVTTKHLLTGKVYMVQNDKLPFAALHGDPDILLDGKTRFGPTALMLPKLERYKPGTYIEWFKTLNLDLSIIKIFWNLIIDTEIRNYVLKNFLFEIPYLNKKVFLKDARKIVPSLEESDIEYAKGFGGVRPQVLDKDKEKLVLGEASIDDGDGIVFNMTPSPGATSCLGNAERDLHKIVKFLNLNFNEELFLKELTEK